MKKNKGITLLELVIAISLFVLIGAVIVEIHISSWQMFKDALYIAQAQRNAMVPMAHMVKNIQQGASGCNDTDVIVDELPHPALQFMVDGVSPIPPSTIRLYVLIDNEIRYYENYDSGSALDDQSFNIIGTHIDGATFTVHHLENDGIVVEIYITSDDNRDQDLNRYRIRSSVTVRYSAVPPVYGVPSGGGAVVGPSFTIF